MVYSETLMHFAEHAGLDAQALLATEELVVDRGVMSDKAKSLEKGVKNFGIPFIGYALEHIEREAQGKEDTAILDEVKTLREAIQDVNEKLGGMSNRFGIERRGAEVHISMDPSDYRAA